MGEGVKDSKNSQNSKKKIALKIHVGIKYLEQISQEEIMYFISSKKL